MQLLQVSMAGVKHLKAENFNPVAIRVVYKVKPHFVIFVANAAQCFVESSYGLVVAWYTHADVKLVFA